MNMELTLQLLGHLWLILDGNVHKEFLVLVVFIFRMNQMVLALNFITKPSRFAAPITVGFITHHVYLYANLL